MEKNTPDIIHLDLDAFYASVEQHDNPELRGRKVIVGGSRERGVVCACSYDTRPFGIRSGMAIREALRFCPDALILPVRMNRYREVSQQIFQIYASYTDLVEPLSIDEAFLDVSGSTSLLGDAFTIAKKIKEEVRGKTGLALSVGVAPNKMLAKLASEQGKPDGLYLLTANRVDDFLTTLPVANLWGVGRKTQKQLRLLGVETVADLRRIGFDTLVRMYGENSGRHLYDMARGIDKRHVEPPGRAKSVGRERTFDCDVKCHEVLEQELLLLSDQVGSRLREKDLKGRTVSIKVKYDDFQTLTRSFTLPQATSHGPDIYRLARRLLGDLENRKAIRLLGVTVSHFESEEDNQPWLFNDDQKGLLCRLDEGIDKIRGKYGDQSIIPGSLLPGRGKKSNDR
ncbi:MAG: DNA polymerase IV [Deltaproteobacteria bacterium]|nr:DNA polymerase IV [Deltaproteobacteria bacterium]